ncbi:MAG: hypothetical protein E6K78_03615 [Candidatus Eisenbacteria bacterium]|uniref:Uncharacterized protein n=1 Tax=Eiseniibacteriota bacterium TaxID=2212470 RepID=A0A538TVT5_UNCEI|nr:MAG: hypothetical protein E6K78_03615 [Candidatus Eisenbacteria bacterium]
MTFGRVLRMLQHIVLSDFRERVRRHAFIITLAFTVYAAYIFLPPNGAPYVTFQVGGARGLYDSAWVGCTVALLTSAFLSLAGFYLVKNAIERDRSTGVGQILATTPITKPLYTLGKAISNFAVLAVLACAVAVCAIGMQLLRAEHTDVRPLDVFAPFAIATLPALAVVAALAVLFEAIPWLRGGLGNIVYFFLWGALAMPGSSLVVPQPGLGNALGTSALVPQMARGVASAFPDIDLATARTSLGLTFTERPLQLRTFDWAGLEWDPSTVLPRLAWMAIAAAIALLAAVPFDRFDVARGVGIRLRGRRQAGAEFGPPVSELDQATSSVRAPVLVEPPSIAQRDDRLVAMLRAELLLVRKDMPRAWALVALALGVACWLAPLTIARFWLSPFAWIWPVLLWSALGAREARHGTHALVFPAPHPIARQLKATWLSGFSIALAMGSGVGVRLALAGDTAGALSWLVGATFIPSMALACGVWTGSGKLFEILYLLLWYAGPLNHVPFLDYAATVPASVVSGAPLGFGAAALALLAIATAGRARRIKR